MARPLPQLPAHVAYSRTRVHVVVETPKGSRNKVVFDPKLKVFNPKDVLPEGRSVPYYFSFVPSPLAADGDLLAALLLLGAPAFPGCVVEALEIEQHETDGTVQRNDRLVAVAAHSREHHMLHRLTDLLPVILHEAARFFHSCNEAKGDEIKVLQRVGPGRAHQLLTRALN